MDEKESREKNGKGSRGRNEEMSGNEEMKNEEDTKGR